MLVAPRATNRQVTETSVGQALIGRFDHRVTETSGEAAQQRLRGPPERCFDREMVEGPDGRGPPSRWAR